MIYRNLSLSALQKVASELAREIDKKPAVIGLSGNLGSGKTTFAKAFARALGLKNLKSPTFIISQRYQMKSRFLYHLDFYRLGHKSELGPLGLSEILSRDNIVLIEWVEKFPEIRRSCDILINFQTPARPAGGKPNNVRNVTIKTRHPSRT